ncbi:MAG TPA: carboxypeptidase-like regulatory domain-containing protein [Vicinamibacterales bacterium]
MPSAVGGNVEGLVLWNEQPVAGARVVATSEYNFASTHYGEATTDVTGHFSIPGVPAGQKYLYVFGNDPAYWVSAVTPFQMPANTSIAAPDTYLCRRFEALSPEAGESLIVGRPLLRWTAYPDAVDYAVRVIRTGQNSSAFSRGDRDARLTNTTAQVDVDLAPGQYSWRVDAFNRGGHIIACSQYPRTFTISAGQPSLSTAASASPPTAGATPTRDDIDPDRHIYGIPLGTSMAQFVGAQGQPTGEMHVNGSETVLLYGRSHAFYFHGDRLVGTWVRQGGYIVDFRLVEALEGTTRFDGVGWHLDNGIQAGMNLAQIKKILGDKLFGCGPASGPGLPRCYFTTERSRVEFDVLTRTAPGVSGDEAIVAVGVIVKAGRP